MAPWDRRPAARECCPPCDTYLVQIKSQATACGPGLLLLGTTCTQQEQYPQTAVAPWDRRPAARECCPPCDTYIVQIKSQATACGPGLLPMGTTCTQQEQYPQTAIGNRLRVAILHFAEISTALPAPSWKRAPALLIAHGQVVAGRAAGREPCGQGCIVYAPEVLHGAAVRTRAYLPHCPEK